MTRRIPHVFLALILLLATSGSAMGVTTVTRSGTAITITGDDTANAVDIVTAGDAGPLTFKDPQGMVSGGGECAVVDPTTVQCGTAGPGLVATVTLGGGDDIFRPDTIVLTAPVVVVELGAGNDISWGSGGNDTINGGDGNDDINTRGGQDTIDGGPGNDRLAGAGGDDTITGGPGLDSIFGDGEFAGLAYGNDTLKSQDGEIDSLSCSFGADTVIGDPNDSFDVLGDCETRTLSGGALSVGFGVPKAPKLALFAAGRSLKFNVTVSAPCTLEAGIVLRKAEARRLKIGNKDTIIGAAAAAIRAPGTYAASLSVATKYRAKLRGHARVTTYVLLLCETETGATDTALRRVIIRK
jgi:Ca2+-binding RTX toxin-like protein